MLLKPNDHILFYGDSITDCGRRTEKIHNNYGMGRGYAAIAWSLLASRYAPWNFTFSNRGVSGDRIGDLQRRLDEDVLVLKPTVVSIMIGINDTWRRYDKRDPSPIPQFEDNYRQMLGRIKERLSPRLVICEPFLMPFNDRAREMREDLNPRIDAIRRLAAEFEATYVPLDGLFAAACCRAPVSFWTDDGIHPLPPGHGLIAEAWIDAVTA